MGSTLKDTTLDGSASRDTGRLIRKAFVLQLRPGAAEEYRRRHESIWPELVATLRAHGVHRYSIFWCESRSLLFACVEFDDPKRWEEIGCTEVGRRWRLYMSDLLVTNSDFSPVTSPLHEVFHLD
jgi:L-rhamnose mutarotase